MLLSLKAFVPVALEDTVAVGPSVLDTTSKLLLVIGILST